MNNMPLEERFMLYVERIEILSDEIDDMKDLAYDEHCICVEANSIDDDMYMPSDLLVEYLSKLYGLTKFKKELCNRARDLVRVWKLDPAHDKETLTNFSTVADNLSEMIIDDDKYIDNLANNLNIPDCSFNALILDEDGNVLEEINLD